MKRILGVVVCMAMPCWAAGPLFAEMGSMSVSTAGAGSAAIAEGAETAFSNPAGMVRFSRPAWAVQSQMVSSSIHYQDNGSSGLFAQGSDGGDAGTTALAAGLYWVQPLNREWAFGLSLASRGGSALDYGSDFRGALLVTEFDLLSLQVNPSIAYAITPNWSLALGVALEYARLEETLGIPETQRQLFVEGDSWNMGINLGLMYQFNHDHRLGVSFRMKADHQFEGRASLNGRDGEVADSVNFPFPATAVLSGVHEFHYLSVLWNFGYTWLDVLDTTTYELNERPVREIDRQWQDTWNGALGVHVPLNRYWRLEFGIGYEQSPQDDPAYQYPDLPVDTFIRYGLGASYRFDDHWRAQLFYEYLDAGEPLIDRAFGDQGQLGRFSGQWNNAIEFIGLAVNFRY
ncbi:long-chain fatty acid transport protein [Ferrimonas sediminum]|uniref:Long-chain fatty acid transport protein n=1 Tax=Ferrimonas sediminum TaxID=718193 RepID=A0A1G8W4C9_9GAMM|nr:outer membrane protein transport protein [Ferrimonas sediminum]SDJ72927.1 long-chain fatty acid transport protein [Ferrimonas sediminum]